MGLTREALPERGTFSRLQVHEMEGFFMVEGCENLSSVLAIYSYCKDGVSRCSYSS